MNVAKFTFLSGVLPAVVAMVLLPLSAAADGTLRADDHAPAGVAVEHVHAAGGWMLGYRYSDVVTRDLMRGSDSIGLTDPALAGYTAVATHMTMRMHMFDIMYAPSDRLTLMVMPQYMSMDMTMTELPPSPPTTRSHGSAGLGDTQLAALYELGRSGNSQWLGTLAFSAPTGAADSKGADGEYVHYGMQPGSGIWEILPSLTLRTTGAQWSWGAQAQARLHLEDRNNAGFRFGDSRGATAWVSKPWGPTLSASLRLAYQWQDVVKGHYNAGHHHHSPSGRQRNYGGESLHAGIGINAVIGAGSLRGLRLGGEYLFALQENLNGVQNGLEQGLVFSVSRGF